MNIEKMQGKIYKHFYVVEIFVVDTMGLILSLLLDYECLKNVLYFY